MSNHKSCFPLQKFGKHENVPIHFNINLILLELSFTLPFLLGNVHIFLCLSSDVILFFIFLRCYILQWKVG